MIPAYKLCKDCRHFRPYTEAQKDGDCAHQWHNYVTGAPINFGDTISVHRARRDYCQSACGWEAKEAQQ